MNKKEINEIRKNLKPDAPFCVVNSAWVAVVDSDEEYKLIKPISMLVGTEYEHRILYTALRSVISTKLNKRFTEYDFKKEAYEDNGSQNILYIGSKDGLKRVESFVKVADLIRKRYTSDAPYAIIAAQATYTVRRRNRADEDDEFNHEDFNFLIFAVCPAHTIDCGFSYDYAENKFSSEPDSKLYINPDPIHGFMFPSFSDRTADINSVMYYTKDPKNPSSEFVDNVLGCTFEMSPEMETYTFKNIIKGTFGSELDYPTLYAFNDQLIDLQETFKSDSKPYLVGKRELLEIVSILNLDSEVYDTISNVYDQNVFEGFKGFHLENIIDHKIKLQTSEYTISFKASVNSDHVNTADKTIRLNTDDSTVDINGLVVDI